MALIVDQQLSIADFITRPWTVYSSANQELPTAYRQPKYRWNSPVFKSKIREQDVTGNPRPEYHWARLFSDTRDVAQYLANMSDSRNSLEDPLIDHVNLLRGTPWGWDGLNLDAEAHSRMFVHLQRTFNFVFMDALFRLTPPLDMVNMTNWETFLNDRMFRSLLAHCQDVQQLEDIQNHRLQSGVGSHVDGFEWIEAFTASIRDAHQSMSAAWEWASVKRGRSFEDALQNAVQDIPEMTRLLLILLEREKSFNTVLCQEHIFGCLYDKRIRLLNPRVFSTLWNRLGAMSMDNATDFPDMWHSLYRHLEPLYASLAEYQLRLGELFDYKSLMEWHYNKTWDKLYVLINPSMKEPSMRNPYMGGISDVTIQKFVNWSNRNGEIANNIFGVHPILNRELEGKTCTVCLEGYDGNNHPTGVLVLKTFCGHYFHTKCIFSAWDAPSLWDNRCPECRHPSTTLRTTINFDPQWEDVDFGHPANHIERDAHWAKQMTDAITQDARDYQIPLNWAPQVMDAFWRPSLDEAIRVPLRAHREANRPSWESVLGA